jgi:hypothetical protein
MYTIADLSPIGAMVWALSTAVFVSASSIEQKGKNITQFLCFGFFGSITRGGVAPRISSKFTVPDWGIGCAAHFRLKRK